MARTLATAAAVVLTSAALFAQGQAQPAAKPGVEILTPQKQSAAKNLLQDVSATGCIRLWQPQPDDPTKMPADRQPGLAGVYLLTPLASNPSTQADMPTYVLTPSATLSFSQHVGHQVTITGTSQAAPLPPTVQESVNAPTLRPENKPTTNGLPRLTASTLAMVAETCP